MGPCLQQQRTQEKGADKAFYSPADWGYVSKEELKQREIESKEAARMVRAPCSFLAGLPTPESWTAQYARFRFAKRPVAVAQ